MDEVKIYGVLGADLEHSLEPELHSLLGDPDFKLFGIARDGLAGFMKKREFDGLTVADPYKRLIMPMLSKTSESARRLGCVNTVVKADGKLFGYNTDVFGFMYLLDFAGADVKGKKCLIIGDGGTAAAVREALSIREAGEVLTFTASGKNRISDVGTHADAEILINTTDTGRYPNNGVAPVSLDGLTSLSFVFDVIYNPIKSRLLLDAEVRGIPAYNGLPMLAASAKRSREYFYNGTIDDDVLPPIIARMTGHMMNVTLIGMPGCGKTTIGAALAERLGRKQYDLDSIIEKMYKNTPEKIILRNGEAEFRRAEHVAAEWTGKHTGVVISTGGGIVKREDNRAAFAQNGIIIFINRKLEDLATDGRPLSKAKPLDELYAERLPLYKQWCDLEVSNDGSVEETVDAILKNI